jgi:hypothetical protein
MAHKRGHEKIARTKGEASKVVKVCEIDGSSPDLVAEGLIHAAFERRMRKRTGKAPARVFDIRGKR